MSEPEVPFRITEQGMWSCFLLKALKECFFFFFSLLSFKKCHIKKNDTIIKNLANREQVIFFVVFFSA